MFLTALFIVALSRKWLRWTHYGIFTQQSKRESAPDSRSRAGDFQIIMLSKRTQTRKYAYGMTTYAYEFPEKAKL